jgi:hypothetical protein
MCDRRRDAPCRFTSCDVTVSILASPDDQSSEHAPAARNKLRENGEIEAIDE